MAKEELKELDSNNSTSKTAFEQILRIINFERLFGYFYGGLLFLLIAVVINTEYIAKIIKALGGTFTLLVCLIVGAIEIIGSGNHRVSP